MESITIAYAPYMETAFYWIAQDQQFFSQNGLDLTFVKYSSLVSAVNDLIQGKVDVVGNVTEFPLASRALSSAAISTFCSIATSKSTYLIARKDRGINQVTDLKGKKIGSISGSITDFYIGQLLELTGMSINDISLVNVNSASGAVTAIENGDVDAVVVGQPYASSAITQLGTNCFSQSAQSGQASYALAVSTNQWITSHADVVRRLLKSLSQSQAFLEKHQPAAKTLIENQLNFDASYLDSVWSQ